MQRINPNNTFVQPTMPFPAKDLGRIVIGDAPGKDDSDAGKPFAGGVGRWLDKMLERAHIDREGVALANCIQCRPPNSVFPTHADAKSYISKPDGHKAVDHCLRAHVYPIIEHRRWNRVDLLGDTALTNLAGRSGIYKWRGSPTTISTPSGKILPALATLHPDSIMRDQTMFPVVVNDLMKSLVEPPEFYTPFASLEDLRTFTHKRFAFDIETNGWSREIVCIGFSAKPNFAMVVPFTAAYIPEIKRLFREATEVIGHNCIQFDLPILVEKGVTLSPDCKVWDTMLMHHLCFPQFSKVELSSDADAKSTGGGHDLEFLGTQFTSKPAWKHEKGVLQVYCCRDVDVTMQAWHQLIGLLKEEKLLSLYENVQVPLAKICYLMGSTGIKLDPNKIKEARKKFLEEIDREEKYLPEQLRSFDRPCNKRRPAREGEYDKAGKQRKFVLEASSKRIVPWRSTVTKLGYFYGERSESCLGFEEILDAKKGTVTTGKIAIAKIVSRLRKDDRGAEARAVQAIGRLNKLDELITTFAKEDMVKVARLYPHFNVHGTASGRLSSSNPNLQNIPESTRFLYVPSHPGWKIIDVDFSNIENRLTARLANDTDRLNRYNDPKYSDYKILVTRAYDIAYEDVVKDNDREAPYGKCKAIVLGMNYGLGAKKISNLYDMDLKEVHHLVNTWKKEIPYTVLWQQRTTELAKKQGYLVTPFGRKRWFYTQNSYTESLSFLPQSCAADVIFRAMIVLMHERIGLSREAALKLMPVVYALPEPARLLLQVHDSLVIECPTDSVGTVVAILRLVMEQPILELKNIRIPISIKVGDSWGETEDYQDITLN